LGLTGLLAFFSLAGVPPLAGFFAKIEIFISAFHAFLFLTCTILILCSIISTFFYLRVIKVMFFDKKKHTNSLIFGVTRECSLVMGFSIFLLLFLFINPSLLLLITQKMALCLF